MACLLGAVDEAGANILNGSFETGDYTNWTLFEDSGVPSNGTWGIATNGQTIMDGEATFDFFDGVLVTQNSRGLPITYTGTGNFVAYQLQNRPERHRMFQDVTLAAAASTLNWDMQYNNSFGAGFNGDQFLAVHIRDLSDMILQTLFITTEGVDPRSIPMTTFSADISAFAGMIVRIDVELNPQEFWFPAAFDNFVVLPQADLSVTKGDSPDPVAAGAALIYTLNVSNGGPSTATSLSVSDTLPAGVGFVSAAGTDWSCGEAGGVVTCTRASLAVGAAPAITINVTAPSAGGSITNNVSVSAAEPDPVSANNTATEDTTVVSAANLSVTKSESQDPVPAGAPLSYTVTVSNAGPSDALNVTVSDTLPAGVTFVSTGGCLNDPNGVPTCDLGTIAAGASEHYTIDVTVDLSATGTITNTVIVSSETSDSDTSDNMVSEDTLVEEFPPLPSMPDIPTLSRVGLAVLAALLGVGGSLLSRRRRRAEQCVARLDKSEASD